MTDMEDVQANEHEHDSEHDSGHDSEMDSDAKEYVFPRDATYERERNEVETCSNLRMPLLLMLNDTNSILRTNRENEVREELEAHNGLSIHPTNMHAFVLEIMKEMGVICTDDASTISNTASNNDTPLDSRMPFTACALEVLQRNTEQFAIHAMAAVRANAKKGLRVTAIPKDFVNLKQTPRHPSVSNAAHVCYAGCTIHSLHASRCVYIYETLINTPLGIIPDLVDIALQYDPDLCYPAALNAIDRRQRQKISASGQRQLHESRVLPVS